MRDHERSHWHWGYTSRLPDLEARRGLASMVAALLGVAPREPAPLPSLDDVTLRPPRFDLPPELARLGSSERDARVRRTYGRGYRDLVRGFRGDFAAAPDWVLTPSTEDEIAAILRHASAHAIAVVPFGGGTSVVGGVEGDVPARYRGVISLDLERLDRVLEVDPTSRAARIQAGARGPAILEQLAAHDLTLRFFPQSFEFSTLGGWIATRAGGHYATLHTHIDDLVESVRMVTPSGVFATRRLPASGAGPSPERLVLGSEGALGVITEAWVRVQERPRFRASASVRFERFADGARASRALAQSGLHPTNCRLVDGTEALLNGLSTDRKSVLLLGFESSDHALGPWIERALAITAEHGGVCPEGATIAEAKKAEGNEAYRQSFFQMPYLQSALVSLGFLADTFETACTWDRFDALDADVRASVKDAMVREAGAGILARRFTHVYPDGPAPYFTFITPARPGEELEQWAAIKRAASEALARAGATITHHHAVGRVHRPWYDAERPDAFARVLRAAKRELDPASVLNPGVLIDPE